MRNNKRYITLIIMTIISFGLINGTANANEIKKLRVDARNAIAIERESRQILFEQNAYEVVPMASTTKILTALVAIENGNLEKEIEISKNAAAVRGSTVGYKAGEKIKLKELLYGLMYRSGNDAAIAIAEGIGGSVEEYAKMMNHMSSGLGLIDSHFQTPHGLDKEDHYSSAYDLAILTSKAMEYKLFREIVGSKVVNKGEMGFTRDYNNINKILWRIPGANGVKTGYTGGAGKCLVTSVNHNGKDIIIVVLNCTDRWNQTAKIYDYVKDKYTFNKKQIKDLVKTEGYMSLGKIVKNEEVIHAYSKEDTQYDVDVFNPVTDLNEGEIIGAFKVKEKNKLKGEHALKIDKGMTTYEFKNIMNME